MNREEIIEMWKLNESVLDETFNRNMYAMNDLHALGEIPYNHSDLLISYLFGKLGIEREMGYDKENADASQY